MRLQVREAIPLGVSVEVEIAESKFLGEVVWSRPSADHYEIGIAIVHVVNCLRKLADISRFVSSPLFEDTLLPQPLPRSSRLKPSSPTTGSGPSVIYRHR
jgi:hypothetical protein